MTILKFDLTNDIVKSKTCSFFKSVYFWHFQFLNL